MTTEGSCPQAWHVGLAIGQLTECKYQADHRGWHRDAHGHLAWGGKLTAEEMAIADALRAAQDGGAEEAVRERMAHVWADPFGQWNAEQADAARQQKAEMLRAALAPQAGGA